MGTDAVPCAGDIVWVSALKGCECRTELSQVASRPGAGEGAVPNFPEQVGNEASGSNILREHDKNGLYLLPVDAVGSIVEERAPVGTLGILTQIIHLGASIWIGARGSRRSEAKNGFAIQTVQLCASLMEKRLGRACAAGTDGMAELVAHTLEQERPLEEGL